MRLQGGSRVLAGALFMLLAAPGVARADEISPAIYLMVDTSGSMILNQGGTTYCRGDGSAEHPHLAGCTSRMYMAKNAISTVVDGYPEVRWGLARFGQTEGWNTNCLHYTAAPTSTAAPCSAATPGSPWEIGPTGAAVCVRSTLFSQYNWSHDLGNNDRKCINYRGACIDADILVALADANDLQVRSWVNHSEPATSWFGGLNPTSGDHCWDAANGRFGDCEIRAHGNTPLGGALTALRTQISENDLENDTRKGCRPYVIILITDGDETCGGNPNTAAANLLTTPDLHSTCATDDDCPVNSWCAGTYCNYRVKTYVIGLDTTATTLNDIAYNGGTLLSIPAASENDMVVSMANIIADSVYPELCNGVDDNCNAEVDEGYPLGDPCDNGLLGECHAVGEYICDPADPTGVVCDAAGIAPDTEVCDGLDNDCDGLVDEDDVCCDGPELCNGVDDYCGNAPPGMVDGDQDTRVWSDVIGRVRRICGTDVGICEFGQSFCVGGQVVCQNGTGPEAVEQCDPLDRNCNGMPNDVPPRGCNLTNTHGTCPGVQICELPGQWSTCMGQPPAAEICNGLDENCNAVADEGLDFLIWCGVGACLHSVVYCTGGSENTCNPMQGAGPETCNNIDDDCNGATDDGLGTTTCGLGVCQHTVSNCVSGSPTTCNPMQGASPEVCNALDDDCDGTPDDGLLPRTCYPAPAGCGESPPGTWTCQGTCATGLSSCVGGSWGSCTGARTPVPEICDGLDNDCNGLLDDGLGSTWCGLGICLHEQPNCVAGSLVVCNPVQGAAAETCNGLDDDCDGQVDDGVTRQCYSAATPGCTESAPGSGVWSCLGECALGVEACTTDGSGSWSGTCVGDATPLPEVCDGLDNDCDGTVDDGIVRACYPFGSGCVARADGTGYDCVGQCAAGAQACVVDSTGVWGACVAAVGPVPESCNGADDDCDGQTDEDSSGQPLSQSCSVNNGYGTCGGTQACSGGGWGACSATVPGPEAWADPNVNPAVCDTLDQDCDGVVNDGVPPRDCSITNTHGTCPGTATCTAQGTWVNCTARTPQAETCNGVDDDCDGTVDEDASGQPLTQPCYTGPSGTAGVGVCAAGVRTCAAGSWGACLGQVLPTPEVCDGLDNDCDGASDDGLGSTWCGLGACHHEQPSCVSGSPVVCNPLQGATAETCNGVDDDCDGLVDDGVTRQCYATATPGCTETAPGSGVFDCVGECAAGVEACSDDGSGTWSGTCIGDATPMPEVCDGLDNDCDGTVDDGIARACYPFGSGCVARADGSGYDCAGLCAAGTQACVEDASGVWGGCVAAVGPATETCNGVDDDCDGQTDVDASGQPLSQACIVSNGSGTCGGVQVCTAGGWGTCSAAQPGPEAWADPDVNPAVCDTIDQDCNGVVNDGVPPRDCSITNAYGTCPGSATCTAQGTWVGCTAKVPQAETCNGVDDDCDGLTDEDDLGNPLAQVCYSGPAGTEGVGVCAAGARTCNTGGWTSCLGQVLPTPEVCDGVDNDCDGAVDDGLGSTWCGLGACHHEQPSCVSGSPVACNPLQGATAETCNGVDDDCDGLVDDGVTRQCYAPATPGCVETAPGSGIFTCLGECAAGVEACSDDGSGTWSGSCVGDATPTLEACDGRDNDCDGTVDNGVARSCYPFGSGCVARADGTGHDCVGLCAAGTQACVEDASGVWGGCVNPVGPVAEECNGVDDDCDGDTDEDEAGQPLAMACTRTNAAGTCGGVQTCTAGGWGTCGAAEPGPEAWADPNVNPAVCDTIDQDCDGVVNDGVPPRTCSLTNAHGTCPGTETCTAQGTWVNCTAREPQAETCNGVDDDCDGLTDEDDAGNPLTQPCYAGPAGTDGVGVCTAGVRTCTAGGWSACVGQILPTPEVCDGRDNDCDGSTDEDTTGQPLTRACQNGNAYGTCLGLQTCTGDPTDLWTACTASTPQEEVCDGVDNNCDGVIDGISRTCFPFADGCSPDGAGGFQCQGICWPGIELCPALATPAPANVFGTCEYAVGPAPEVCDGLDNDCDGGTDEDALGAPLTQGCYGPGYGGNTGCTAPGDCAGVCHDGLQTCGDVVAGQWGGCEGEVAPGLEVCDATDNDCDGETDEVEDMPWLGQPCTQDATGDPVCHGIWTCTEGVEACQGGAVDPGRCDGLDNDCDGVIDELDELLQDPVHDTACGTDIGECQIGTFQCIGGSWSCQGQVQPAEETCDGLDNDCDTRVDNGAVCAAVGGRDAYCIEAECRMECEPTSEMPCPPGLECVERLTEQGDQFVCMPIVGNCGGETCPSGWTCVNDECVDPCAAVTCESWQECRLGFCVDASCSAPGVGCPDGEICLEHACVADPCLTATCFAEGGYCVRECVGATCTARCEGLCECAGNQYCDATGACAADPCHGTTCEEGQRCSRQTGQCEDDPCHGFTCFNQTVCFEGACIEDPCGALSCPWPYTCTLQPGTNDQGETVPVPGCERAPGLWVDGQDGNKFLATGGGGCQCSAPGSRSGGGAAGLGLLLLGWLLDRRRRAARRPAAGGARGARGFRLLLVAALLLPGLGACRVDPWETGHGGHWLDAGPAPDAAPRPDGAADACVSTMEVCDGVDNDCNGIVDDASNLDRDVSNCGACGNACHFEHAVPTCEASQCVMGDCLPGYHDVNGVPADGCEYGCTVTNLGVEACDGRDNDCNGETDETFDLTSDPDNCGACWNPCVFLNGTGACVDSECVLDGCRGGFRDLDGDVDTGCECQIQLSEDATPLTPCVPGVDACPAGDECADPDRDGQSHCLSIPLDQCDGRDNDCDGTVDEDATALLDSDVCYPFPSGCAELSPGAFTCDGPCRPGRLQCLGGALRCLGHQGPTMETCNDVDDDCNGVVDDGVDKLTDPNNCGGCGNACAPLLPNAIPACVAGHCERLVCLPGYWDLDPAQAGCEYACVISNGGVEACGDGLDNDCNGQVDEGFDLDSDPINCGACGHSCEVFKPYGTRVSAPACTARTCRFECLPGYHDRNGDLATLGEAGNGCEDYCEVTSPTELCDGLDNDCNGQVDEGFDLQSDATHCGACGRSCEAVKGANSVVTGCVSGSCQYACSGPGFVDRNGDLALGSAGNGCECASSPEVCDGVDNDCDGSIDERDAGGCTVYYRDADLDGHGDPGDSRCLCAADVAGRYTALVASDCNDQNLRVHPGATEVCDGVDNDCDGQTDRSALGVVLTRTCYTGAAGTSGVGPCHGGTQTCTAGGWSATCAGEVTPQLEQCDGVDNNCSGVTDEGFDTTVNPQHCGGCNQRCSDLVPNAVSTCQASTCVVMACLPGFYDLDPVQPGCEYPCTLQNGGMRTCGSTVDNDCNGLVDASEFDLETDPVNCGGCGHSCEAFKPFGTQVAHPECTSGTCRFECLPDYHDRNGDLATLGEASNGCEDYCQVTSPTELCDGLDNDCNGQVDEGFDLLSDPSNCGVCGRSCETLKGANTVATGCGSGTCQFACAGPGFVDRNGDLALGSAGNGCECAASPEVCDGADNDCDGSVDESGAGGCTVYYRDADLDGYGNPADSRCLCAPDVVGRYTALSAGDCNDLNASIRPGAVEVCDGVDNDCDGQTDRSALGVVLTRACYTGAGGTQGVGPCHGGIQTCGGGEWSATCAGEVTPQIEQCDGVDNNCSGVTDEGFDTTVNPQHCGACNYRCADHVPNAVSTCQASTCVVMACLPGFYDLDPVQPGCEYPCTLQSGGMKTCGSALDNDCNGLVDASEFDLDTDPVNCGGCGHNCEAFKPYGTQVAAPECTSGTCRFECLPDYYDRNSDLATLGEASNGCEDYCQVTSPTELCDGQDNDCDGQIDEGFDLQSDLTNCGVCGRSCEAVKGANTVVTGCLTGACQFACAGPGFVDRNGDLALGNAGNGCECAVNPEVCDGADNDCDGSVDEAGAGGCTVYYRDADLDGYGNPADSRCLCAPDVAGRYTALSAGDCNDLNASIRPGAVEVCDGADNDCDGQTDRSALGVVLTRACYTGAAGTQGVGPCHGGTQTCTGGEWSASCAGEVTPQLEQCDGVDNNCSGVTDEGFDLTVNPQHCGGCNYRCTEHVPNAVSTCQASTCVVVACLPGFYDLDAGQPGCEYPCTLQNGGVKTCGSPVDNDCNGAVDAGEFDVQVDPANCGACGHSCEASRPGGTQVASPNGCVAGGCRFTCLAGYRDVNGDLTLGETGNGCECAITNGGTEICDSIDNDCDGSVDEGFDLQTNPLHCGACNHACSALGNPATVHAQLDGCIAGRCRFSCLAGWHDLNGNLNSGVAFGASNDGCEYACTPDGAESCDAKDNDCNGLVDEGTDRLPLRRACYTGTPGTETHLPCRQGIETCNPATGTFDSGCLGQITPTAEVCGDGVDNDCDGTPDDGFDFQTDTYHCGACNHSCVSPLSMPANAVPASPACQSGTCHYVCIAGFADLNGDLNSGNPPGPTNNGCEHTCARYPTTAEECNGIDDDCDGEVDEGLPAFQSICYQGSATSACQGVTATCRDPDGAGPLAKGWWCNYPAAVEVESGNPNAVYPVETLCNGADGDCDGLVDDDFAVGDACTNGAKGACRLEAVLVCDGTTTTRCDLPDPAGWPTPTDEICDDVDNDCDGLTDESPVSNVAANDLAGSHVKWVVEPVVTVIRPDGHTSDVYLYEASRPTADATSPGVGTAVRSCSRPDVVPWSFVTYRQAARACAMAGMRLCQPAEWTEACDGSGVDYVYPYGALTTSYDPERCNGAESDLGAGDVLPTAELDQCTSLGYGAHDLSGNLREWTTDRVGYSSSGQPIHRVRGGSYLDYATGLQCDFDNASAVEDVPTEAVGFRCCTSCGNGFVETWEQCDGAAGCHPELCVWDACGDGVLDAGEACDDGNNLPFDGCAPNCTQEWTYRRELETNNSCANAITVNNRAAPPVLFSGSWENDYSDYYAIDIPAGTHTLRVQTFDRFGPSTCATINTEVYVYNASCTQVLYSNSNNGPGNCENVTVASITGPVTYYVRIQERNSDNRGYYTFLVTLE